MSVSKDSNIDTCDHLCNVPDAESNYHVVLAYYVTCIAEGSSKRKAQDAYCVFCKSTYRIHACLECAFFGCFDLENAAKNSHMELHAKENDHCFAININNGSLFCFECEDYIYNAAFENIYTDYKLEARKINGYQFYMPWRPKADEINLLKDKIKKISDDSYIGLRGIVNIGNTCYIAVIIQMFMHNPVLRDFFLADKHICSKSDSCLTCTLFELFQKFYSGISVPFNPDELITRVLVKHCNIKLGDPQDPVELYLNILEKLQGNSQRDKWIHQKFYGITEIKETCQDCEFSTNSSEHFSVINLNPDEGKVSLYKLLERKYCEPEYHNKRCSSCKQACKIRSEETVKKLPNVICFHINCVKVKPKNNTSKQRKKKSELVKKSVDLTFNEWIDMSDYVNSISDSKLVNGNHSANSFAIDSRFCLFAVICHKGDGVTNGHNLVYVRQRGNRWYECDDKFVYKQSLENVLECKPYCLFYFKQ